MLVVTPSVASKQRGPKRPVVRGYRENGKSYYVGRDLAKVMGFSDVGEALIACDPLFRGKEFIHGGMLGSEGMMVIMNEGGKQAMLNWAKSHGRISQGVTFDMSFFKRG